MIDITKQTKAVTAWASRGENRTNLESVYFHDGLTVATNGHGLAMLYREGSVTAADMPAINGQHATDNDAPALLPVEAVTTAIKVVPARPAIPVLAHATEYGARNGSVTLGAAQSLMSVQPVDGDFPAYHEIVPSAENTAFHVNFSAAYLKQVAQSALDIGAQWVRCEFDTGADGSRRPARFTASHDGTTLTIILMPARL
jgi:hypothetical protein